MATQTTAKVLIQGVQLPTAVATQYSAPSSTVTLIKKATVTNPTGLAVPFTAYKVPSAGVASASNVVVNGQVIPANSQVEIYLLENHALNAGDSIQCFAGSVASLTLHVSGIEIQ